MSLLVSYRSVKPLVEISFHPEQDPRMEVDVDANGQDNRHLQRNEIRLFVSVSSVNKPTLLDNDLIAWLFVS